MEALFVLIFLILIAYAIYSNSSQVKYKKAERLLSQKEYIKAQSILVNLFTKHPEALTKYAESFYKLGVQESDAEYFQKAIDCKKYLGPGSNHNSFDLIEAASAYELLKNNFLRYTENVSVAAIEKINNNIQIVSAANHTGKENEFKDLLNQHHKSIAIISYKLGVNEEKKGKFGTAIEFYSIAIFKATQIGITPNFYDASFRKNICSLKLNKELTYTELEGLKNVNHPFNQELYYRYTIQLLQRCIIDDVEEYLNRISIENQNIFLLKKAIKYFQNKSLENDLEKINDAIDKLYNSTNIYTDLEDLYYKVGRISKSISSSNPAVYDQLNALQPSLLNRILILLYENKSYDKIIKLITEFPEFYKNPILMKNLGNACFNITNEGLINDSNYKSIVSSFLTSVFSNRVILASIENTKWDDDYTFTLKDSIGAIQELEDLPSNVNFEDITENNISIGEVQRELLRLYEESLKQNISDIQLQQIVEDFYNSEKETLQNIFMHLKKDSIITTPYFAKKYSLNVDILNDLEQVYLEFSYEDALDIGIRYLSNDENGVISKYNNAKHLINRIVESIKNNDIQELKKIESQFETIVCFNSLGLQLEEEIVKAFHEEINKDTLNEDLVKFYRIIFNVFSFSDKLKYQYGNFITSLCMIKVFEKRALTNIKALKYLTDAYIKTPDNFNVCKSLVLFINNNLFDIINEETYEANKIFEVLNLINQHKSDVFIQNAIVLEEARVRLVSQLPREFLDATKDLNIFNINEKGIKILRCLQQMKLLSSW